MSEQVSKLDVVMGDVVSKIVHQGKFEFAVIATVKDNALKCYMSGQGAETGPDPKQVAAHLTKMAKTLLKDAEAMVNGEGGFLQVDEPQSPDASSN